MHRTVADAAHNPTLLSMLFDQQKSLLEPVAQNSIPLVILQMFSGESQKLSVGQFGAPIVLGTEMGFTR